MFLQSGSCRFIFYPWICHAFLFLFMFCDFCCCPWKLSLFLPDFTDWLWARDVLCLLAGYILSLQISPRWKLNALGIFWTWTLTACAFLKPLHIANFKCLYFPDSHTSFSSGPWVFYCISSLVFSYSRYLWFFGSLEKLLALPTSFSCIFFCQSTKVD